MAKKDQVMKRSESEMDREGGAEASTSTQFLSRCKKGHMINIYLTDSDEEANVTIGAL